MANRWIVASLSGCAALAASACAERAQPAAQDASAEGRNGQLLEAIRDAGYLCDRIVAATAPSGGGGSAWRVLCTDMLVYVASLDAAGAIHIEPIPYGDPGGFPVQQSRDPNTGPETPSPDP